MYANLRVTFGDETLSAWKVEQDEDGVLLVHLDDPDAESNVAEPVGTREIVAQPGKPVTISADF